MSVNLKIASRHRGHARSRPARLRAARLPDAARQARRDHARDRRARARLHGQRAAHDSGHAQLRAARPLALSRVAVHVGQPRRVPRHSGRQEAEGRRHRQRRRHRDQGRLSRRHEPHVLRRQAVDPGEAPGRRHVRGDVARHPRRARRARTSATSAPRSSASPKATASRSCASSAATASAAVPRGAAGAALRPRGHGPQAAGRA